MRHRINIHPFSKDGKLLFIEYLTDDLEIEDLRNDEKKIFSIFASRLKQLKIVSNIIK